MKDLGKIAVIGDKDTALPFKAMALETFVATTEGQIREVVEKLIKDEYSIILITESQAEKITDIIEKIKHQAYPIILPIPNGVSSGSGFGQKNIQTNIEKATGKARAIKGDE